MTTTTTPGATTGISTTATVTPTWYDELSSQMADYLSTGITNIGNLTDNWYNQPLVAGLDPLQTGAINAAGTANNQWQPGFTSAGTTYDAATGQAQSASTFDPNQLQQFMNPYLGGAQQSTINLSNQNLFENVLPKVNSTFSGAGQFGSTRSADFTNRAISNQQRDLTNSLGQLNYGAVNNAMNQYNNWGQLGVQGAQAMGALGQLQQGLGTATANQTWQDLQRQQEFGAIQQAQNQKVLDAGRADWESQINMPINALNAISQAIPRITDLYRGNTVSSSSPTSIPAGTLDYVLAAILGGLGGAAPAGT